MTNDEEIFLDILSEEEEVSDTELFLCWISQYGYKEGYKICQCN